MNELRVQQLKDLIERVGLTHYGKSLRSKNRELLTWIEQETSSLPDDVQLGERVYAVLYGTDDMTCQYGERKLFNTLNKGYRFCAHDCRCRREEQSKKITAHEHSLPTQERQRRMEALKTTLMERYGVDNAMHIDTSKEKYRQTCKIRYGGDHPMFSPEIKNRLKQTQNERYGCHPASLDSTKEKFKQTNLERYGTEHTLGFARAAFAQQTRFDNPFKMREYQDKAKRTMIERYGVEKALSHPEILAKMIADTEAKYGVKSVLMLPQNIALCDARSKIGTAWLDSLGVPLREYKIDLGVTYAKADGFDPETNTAYLFHGDFWHGNPASFSPDEVNPKTGKTFGYLYERTMLSERLIKEAGYNLVTIWEKDWKPIYRRLRTTNSKFNDHSQSLVVSNGEITNS